MWTWIGEYDTLWRTGIVCNYSWSRAVLSFISKKSRIVLKSCRSRMREVVIARHFSNSMWPNPLTTTGFQPKQKNLLKNWNNDEALDEKWHLHKVGVCPNCKWKFGYCFRGSTTTCLPKSRVEDQHARRVGVRVLEYKFELRHSHLGLLTNWTLAIYPAPRVNGNYPVVV